MASIQRQVELKLPYYALYLDADGTLYREVSPPFANSSHLIPAPGMTEDFLKEVGISA